MEDKRPQEINGKLRSRILVSYELLERVLGLGEGRIVSLKDIPESEIVSIVHYDETTALPVAEGMTIPVTEVFRKSSRIYMCKDCKDRKIAEAAREEFGIGEEVYVFVDGVGIKDGVIVESGYDAYKVKVDDWVDVFGTMHISKKKKETEDEESDESEVP